MDVILFLIGVVLFSTRKFRLASLQTAGRHVRAAGVILMLPGAINFMIGIALLFIYGADFEAIFAAFEQIAPLMLVAMIVAVLLAYLLIADPPGAPRLPGILGRIQSERRSGQTPARTAPSPSHPLETLRNQPTRTFGNILSINEAAEYLKVSPQQILEWIEAGKLPAARGSTGYRIARSRLDELGNERSTTQ